MLNEVQSRKVSVLFILILKNDICLIIIFFYILSKIQISTSLAIKHGEKVQNHLLQQTLASIRSSFISVSTFDACISSKNRNKFSFIENYDTELPC